MRINTKRRKCDTMMRHLVKISNILETITIVIKVHKKLPPFKSFWWVKCYGNGSKQKTGTMDYVLWTLIPFNNDTSIHSIQFYIAFGLMMFSGHAKFFCVSGDSKSFSLLFGFDSYYFSWFISRGNNTFWQIEPKWKFINL